MDLGNGCRVCVPSGDQQPLGVAGRAVDRRSTIDRRTAHRLQPIVPPASDTGVERLDMRVVHHNRTGPRPVAIVPSRRRRDDARSMRPRDHVVRPGVAPMLRATANPRREGALTGRVVLIDNVDATGRVCPHPVRVIDCPRGRSQVEPSVLSPAHLRSANRRSSAWTTAPLIHRHEPSEGRLSRIVRRMRYCPRAFGWIPSSSKRSSAVPSLRTLCTSMWLANSDRMNSASDSSSPSHQRAGF